jgi:hypothetical protein
MNRSRVATITDVGTSTRRIHAEDSNFPIASMAASIDHMLVLRNSAIAQLPTFE